MVTPTIEQICNETPLEMKKVLFLYEQRDFSSAIISNKVDRQFGRNMYIPHRENEGWIRDLYLGIEFVSLWFLHIELDQANIPYKQLKNMIDEGQQIQYAIIKWRRELDWLTSFWYSRVFPRPTKDSLLDTIEIW